MTPDEIAQACRSAIEREGPSARLTLTIPAKPTIPRHRRIVVLRGRGGAKLNGTILDDAPSEPGFWVVSVGCVAAMRTLGLA